MGGLWPSWRSGRGLLASWRAVGASWASWGGFWPSLGPVGPVRPASGLLGTKRAAAAGASLASSDCTWCGHAWASLRGSCGLVGVLWALGRAWAMSATGGAAGGPAARVQSVPCRVAAKRRARASRCVARSAFERFPGGDPGTGPLCGRVTALSHSRQGHTTKRPARAHARGGVAVGGCGRGVPGGHPPPPSHDVTNIDPPQTTRRFPGQGCPFLRAQERVRGRVGMGD